MTEVPVPALDGQLRRRLARRFGSGIEDWLDELPPVLSALARRWSIGFESLVQRGTVSVVLACRSDDGRAMVLKISPDRDRIAAEAAALVRRVPIHVPEVHAVDEQVGAILLEAIEPGTPLDRTDAYPDVESVGSLIDGVQVGAAADDRPVADRIAYLYHAGLENYRRRPDVAATVPPALYERGRLLALRLAGDRVGAVGLHGDLTPANLLDGGAHRGLVAIDPAPCRGDPAFDAVDLLLWRAEDAGAVSSRAEQLALRLGQRTERLLGWCAAFAAMTALEESEASAEVSARAEWLVRYAESET